jgi:hypothetical protein
VELGKLASGPSYDEVHAAANAAFGNDPAVKDLVAFGREYDGESVEQAEYGRAIEEHKRAFRTTQGATGDGGRRATSRTPARKYSDFSRARLNIARAAVRRDRKFAAWSEEVEANLAKEEVAAQRLADRRTAEESAANRRRGQRLNCETPPPSLSMTVAAPNGLGRACRLWSVCVCHRPRELLRRPQYHRRFNADPVVYR